MGSCIFPILVFFIAAFLSFKDFLILIGMILSIYCSILFSDFFFSFVGINDPTLFNRITLIVVFLSLAVGAFDFFKLHFYLYKTQIKNFYISFFNKK